MAGPDPTNRPPPPDKKPVPTPAQPPQPAAKPPQPAASKPAPPSPPTAAKPGPPPILPATPPAPGPAQPASSTKPAAPSPPAAAPKPAQPQPPTRPAAPAPAAATKAGQPTAPAKPAPPAPATQAKAPPTAAAAAKPEQKPAETSAGEGLSTDLMNQLIELLRLMGQIINSAALYGPAHKITSKTMQDCFTSLMRLLDKWPRINLTLVEGDLLVEGKPVGLRNPFVNILAAKLSELEIAGFSLLKGMSKEEFYNLMELLITAKGEDVSGDGFADAIAGRGLQHIHAERVKYQRVTEGDVVVGKDRAEDAQKVAQMGFSVEQIMAFLKGDVTVKPEQVSKDIKTVSSDAEQLAGLIMEATAVRQRTTGLESGETLSDIVVGCLRRTFTGLMADPSAKTLTGKKTVKKTMLLLEKAVLDRLHALTGDTDPAMDEAIAATIEEMTDELEIDELTAEYVKRRKALEKTETRVARYMKVHGGELTAEEELQERLAEAGLTPEGWQELLVKTRTAGPAAAAGGADAGAAAKSVAGVGVLAVLLSELDEMMASMPEPSKIGKKVAQLGQRVDQIAGGTAAKIEQLSQKLQQDEQEVLAGADEAKKGKLKMSRKVLMELLAEIVQELCQSLSAINCAVGMTLAGHIGDINAEQREVLGVAANCAHRLDQLLDRLFEIVGLPAGLTPHKEMIYSSGKQPAS